MLKSLLVTAGKKLWQMGIDNKLREIADKIEALDIPDLKVSTDLAFLLMQRNYEGALRTLYARLNESPRSLDRNQTIRDLSHTIAAVYPDAPVFLNDKSRSQILEELTTHLLELSNGVTWTTRDEVWRFLWGQAYQKSRLKGSTHAIWTGDPINYFLEQYILLDTLYTLSSNTDQQRWIQFELDCIREYAKETDQHFTDWRRGVFDWTSYKEGCLTSMLFCLFLPMAAILNFIAF